MCVCGGTCTQWEPLCDYTSHVGSRVPHACASLYMPLHVRMPVGCMWDTGDVHAQVCQAQSVPRHARACSMSACAVCTRVPTRACVCHTKPVCPPYRVRARSPRCPRCPRCGEARCGRGAGAEAGRWGARRGGGRSTAAGARGGASTHRPPNFH